MTAPKDPEKYKLYIERLRASQKKRYENPEEHKKISDSHKGLKYHNRKPVSEETRIKQRNAHLGKRLSEEQRKNIGFTLTGKKHPISPEKIEGWKEKQRLSHLGKPNPNKGKTLWTPEQRKLIGDAQRGKILTLEHRKKISKGLKGRIHSPECRAKISKTLNGHPVPQEQREIQRKKLTGRKQSEQHQMKTTEYLIGGFWYGNIRYPERKYYCELWTPDLCDRIRSAWDHKSAISGKTSVDNRGKKLDCHHVYFQKKACCEWDSDLRGYYVMLNIGTNRKPEIVRHDIKGDPNKFVPLTHSEHSVVRFNKLKWVKYFEDLIESRNGFCYLPKPQ